MTKCVYCCLLASQEFEITPHLNSHYTKDIGKSIFYIKFQVPSPALDSRRHYRRMLYFFILSYFVYSQI
jgi:hypothetical protein